MPSQETKSDSSDYVERVLASHKAIFRPKMELLEIAPGSSRLSILIGRVDDGSFVFGQLSRVMHDSPGTLSVENMLTGGLDYFDIEYYSVTPRECQQGRRGQEVNRRTLSVQTMALEIPSSVLPNEDASARAMVGHISLWALVCIATHLDSNLTRAVQSFGDGRPALFSYNGRGYQKARNQHQDKNGSSKRHRAGSDSDVDVNKRGGSPKRARHSANNEPSNVNTTRNSENPAPAVPNDRYDPPMPPQESEASAESQETSRAAASRRVSKHDPNTESAVAQLPVSRAESSSTKKRNSRSSTVHSADQSDKAVIRPATYSRVCSPESKNTDPLAYPADRIVKLGRRAAREFSDDLESQGKHTTAQNFLVGHKDAETSYRERLRADKHAPN